ncbi:type I restriction endonuclease subunit R [Actinomyces glycerinitolerans]|uniref:Type I restriction enzyme endonuclease subunit n=1 Tax=Actinomyces glycerinitolerans TaxID=1892869 RepID=A0A1M4RZU1_9ACTO|nr:type I restriction endonuclease subunit R [Actinomyces glycerinitolerans]SHE25472.1 restriction endonuclease type i hsdr [Actinomyces glycerinitolerans]
MTIREAHAVRIELVVLTDEATVVGTYEPSERTSKAYQSEADLERAFIAQLQDQAYEYIQFSPDNAEAELIANLRTQLEALNDYHFTDAEWKRFFEHSILTTGGALDVVEKTQRIQEDHIQVLSRDNGESKNIRLIDKQHIHNNRLQVTNQYVATNAARSNRYDVTILVNGLPLVHVELKRRGVDIREAFNQINRYQRDSFWSGAGLFGYVQIFIISNGTYTKYYANTTRQDHVTENRGTQRQVKAATSDAYEFTSWWTDATNQRITDLVDFTRTFLSKHTLLAVLTRYCVFTVADTLADRKLLVMRPYQIAATEAILQRINTSTNARQTGTLAAGGYIWHTTGSGKTLTSFKTAKLAAGMEEIDKVIFVVDRKDLDHQTIKEYNRFAEGTVSANQSTTQLTAQINDPTVKIIVTTIQKLSTFVGRNRKHAVYTGHVVLIFDECHRSQFGDMHTAITKAFRNYHLFGFTGTPIFAENAGSSGNVQLRTTAQAFGDQLHSYTIVDAIGDKNVLPFRIDYIDTVHSRDDVVDAEVSAIDTERALLAPGRIAQVVTYIREHFNQKTRRNRTYTLGQQRLAGFNSLLATASIPAARAYYQEFARQQQGLPSDQRLSVGIIYSYAANAEAPGDSLAEESTDPTALSADDRAFLDAAIADYNQQFGTSYDTSFSGFEGYYEDISARLTKRQIDLVIVVNMFLTGFDSKTLNTLWVDKPLRTHGLIQAFSRTNRILNAVKSYGNIVCFRNLQAETDAAIALFGNKNASGTILLRSYREYLEEFIAKVALLRGKWQPGEVILSEEAQKEFVTLFGQILRLRNILVSFDEFADDNMGGLNDADLADYTSMYLEIHAQMRAASEAEKEVVNEDLVFEIELIKQVEVGVDYILRLVEDKRTQRGDGEDREIPVEIKRAIASSPTLHSKRDLIEDFVRSVSSNGAVDEQWKAFIAARMTAELDAIVTAEGLREAETEEFVGAALRSGVVPTEGTAITRLLPRVSRFRKAAAGQSHDERKARVVEALTAYVERFGDLTNENA